MRSKKGIAIIIFFIIIVITIIVVVLVSNYLHWKVDKMEAEYEARFHTITFDTDGGEYIPPIRVQSTFYSSDKTAKKDGYIFTGWLLNGQPIDESIRITQDITLKASYRKKLNNDSNINNSSNSNNDKPSSSQNNNTSNNTKPSNNNSNTQTQPENKKTYNVNVRKIAKVFEDKDDEKYALTVMNYQTETYNSKVGAVKDGEQWVIVNMKFENMSDSTVVINKNDFKIVDGAGRYGYKPYYKHLDTELDTMEIRAGKSATFSVRFVYYKENEMLLRYYNIDFNTTGYGYIDVKLR